jgi:hypothetical protein
MGWRTSERKGDRTLGKESKKGDRTLGKEGREREIGRSEEKVEKGDRTLGREGGERRPDARKRR